jgi:hypothetical protein
MFTAVRLKHTRYGLFGLKVRGAEAVVIQFEHEILGSSNGSFTSRRRIGLMRGSTS